MKLFFLLLEQFQRGYIFLVLLVFFHHSFCSWSEFIFEIRKAQKWYYGAD